MPRVLTQEQKDKMAEGRRKAAEIKKAEKIASGDLNPDGTKPKIDKPKRVLSEEHKAKMAEGRRKAAAQRKESGDDKSDTKKPRKPRLTKNALLAVKNLVEKDIEELDSTGLNDEEKDEARLSFAQVINYLDMHIGIMNNKEEE